MYFKYDGHKGLRYFKTSDTDHKVLQVCVNSGEIKKGRTNCIGVYLIDRITLIGNYSFFTSGFAPCTKREFDQNMKRVLKLFI